MRRRARRIPLGVDDLIFVRQRRLSYIDPSTGEPVTTADARRNEALSRKLITEWDRNHAGRSAAVQAARNRGELAAALGIDVTELRVAPPRPGDLWMLAAAITIIVGGGAYTLLMLPIGLLLATVAIYRLNPAFRTLPRLLLAVMTTLLLICPAGFCGAGILAVLLNRAGH